MYDLFGISKIFVNSSTGVLLLYGRVVFFQEFGNPCSVPNALEYCFCLSGHGKATALSDQPAVMKQLVPALTRPRSFPEPDSLPVCGMRGEG